MGSARKAIIIILILLLAVCFLFSQEIVTINGKLLLPGTNIAQPYSFKGTVTITSKKIVIICQKRVFRPFNKFDEPHRRKLIIDTKEVDEIAIRKDYLVIYPLRSLYQRYRNIFITDRKFLGLRFWTAVEHEYQVIKFKLDEAMDLKTASAKLFNVINNQAKRLREIFGRRDTLQTVIY